MVLRLECDPLMEELEENTLNICGIWSAIASAAVDRLRSSTTFPNRVLFTLEGASPVSKELQSYTQEYLSWITKQSLTKIIAIISELVLKQFWQKNENFDEIGPTEITQSNLHSPIEIWEFKTYKSVEMPLSQKKLIHSIVYVPSIHGC